MWLCIKCNGLFTNRIDFIVHNSKTCSPTEEKDSVVEMVVNSENTSGTTIHIQNIASTSTSGPTLMFNVNDVDETQCQIEDIELFSSDHSEYIPDGDGSSSSDEDSLYDLTDQQNSTKSLPGHNNGNSVILDGTEKFPETTEKPRKRLSRTENWARNVRKVKRARGESYVSSRNKIIQKVTMKPPCFTNCRKKCFNKINEDERLEIFNCYYNLADYSRQRDFIHSNTEKYTKKCTTSRNSNRSFSISFFLPVKGEKLSVCKPMFLNTLGIKKGVVDIAMKKRTSENTAQLDKRGKHIKKVTPSQVLESVKLHIQSFPTVPSHYCRSSTKRDYLDPSLNITLMYKLYCDLCNSKGQDKVNIAVYRKVFNENFNLGFHRPKKDQCRLCSHYENASVCAKEPLKFAYEAHIANKDRARAEKTKDRLDAEISNGSYICANFDLQQVLLVPTDPTNNALFYKRRLASYNFTIYNVVNKQGDCFMWNETQGARGSCEIASALFTYLKSLPDLTTRVTFFSDRCGGQNLNQFTAAMFLKAVQDLPNLELIDMKFLVSGHSEMECDSIHSAINTEFKRVGKALWPEDWKQIARGARRKGDKPYIVHDLHREDIKNFKLFVKENMTIRKKDKDSNAVLWQKMCWLRFQKSHPFIMKFKETFEGDFKSIDFNRRTRRSAQVQLQPLHANPIPLSLQKYQDLASLFSMKPPALSDAYKPFYLSLPCHDRQDAKQFDEESDDQVYETFFLPKFL